jgi:hypothetical protein
VNGALSSWKTSLFWNNTWIMGCTWLPNLSTYSLAVIQPWRVIMGPTEYCTKPSQNLPCVSLLEPGIPDCRLPWLFYNRKLFLMQETARKTTHLTISRTFPVVWCPGFMVVIPSFMHLSITFSNQRFRNCSPTVDAGYVKLTLDSFCESRVKMNIQFCCHLWFFKTILLNVQLPLSVNVDFCPLLLFTDSLPMIHVCQHNLRNCRSRFTL